MGSLSRLSLINEGKYRAGVDSTAVNLVTEFDQVTRDITGRYDILRGNYAGYSATSSSTYLTGSATNNWLSGPTDIKAVDHLKVDVTAFTTRPAVEMLDSFIFWSNTMSFGAASLPTKGCFDPATSRIYLNPFPSSGNVAYFLWFTKYHPKASGDTYVHILGEGFDEVIVYGLAAYACEIVKQFEKANYFRLVYEEALKVASEVTRKRMVRYEIPER